jgi:hypothetical protein
MEWYRADCHLDNLRPNLLDAVEQLSTLRYYSAGSAGLIGKSYPTPNDVQVWLCFEPRLPSHLEALVAKCEFKKVAAPGAERVPIAWSELFSVPPVPQQPSRQVPTFLQESGVIPA